jgi:uncharacterized protein YodC (DUF2158 family)
MYKQTKRRKTEKPSVKTEEIMEDTNLAHKKPKNINQLPVDVGDAHPVNLTMIALIRFSFLHQVLFEIFQHLSVSDRQAAGMVCKHWFDVSKHSAFLKNCVVKIQNRQFREERIAKNGKKRSQWRTKKNRYIFS